MQDVMVTGGLAALSFKHSGFRVGQCRLPPDRAGNIDMASHAEARPVIQHTAVASVQQQVPTDLQLKLWLN